MMNLRRNRINSNIRDLFSTVALSSDKLIQPYFVYESLTRSEDLPSIAFQKKHTKESLLLAIDEGLKVGVRSILLFFIPKTKGEYNFNYDFETDVIRAIKEHFGISINLFTDMCLCSQTKSGHCGVIDEAGHVHNDRSVALLVEKSIYHAQAGVNAISPSDMMDNRIGAIRTALDDRGFEQTLIMSYSSKFSSNLYGPFREAAESTPSQGDRKSYQIDYRNEYDALRASLRDKEQGADILMVKPAGMYLDIISKIRNHPELCHMPLAAYQVSGEYQMLFEMGKKGLLDFEKTMLEGLYAIRRSGADLIITYAANNFHKIINK